MLHGPGEVVVLPPKVLPGLVLHEVVERGRRLVLPQDQGGWRRALSLALLMHCTPGDAF